MGDDDLPACTKTNGARPPVRPTLSVNVRPVWSALRLYGAMQGIEYCRVNAIYEDKNAYFVGIMPVNCTKMPLICRTIAFMHSCMELGARISFLKTPHNMQKNSNFII